MVLSTNTNNRNASLRSLYSGFYQEDYPVDNTACASPRWGNPVQESSPFLSRTSRCADSSAPPDSHESEISHDENMEPQSDLKQLPSLSWYLAAAPPPFEFPVRKPAEETPPEFCGMQRQSNESGIEVQSGEAEERGADAEFTLTRYESTMRSLGVLSSYEDVPEVHSEDTDLEFSRWGLAYGHPENLEERLLKQSQTKEPAKLRKAKSDCSQLRGRGVRCGCVPAVWRKFKLRKKGYRAVQNGQETADECEHEHELVSMTRSFSDGATLLGWPTSPRARLRPKQRPFKEHSGLHEDLSEVGFFVEPDTFAEPTETTQLLRKPSSKKTK